MDFAKATIADVAKETDRVILFHSATGKDSIALLDLIAPHFKEIVCVFMFIVPGLRHINRYISYASQRYPNARFICVPHYALPSYYKIGYLGCREIPGIKQLTLSKITDAVRERTGIEWVFFGFKQSDSMNRRLMLRTYRDEAINEAQKKCYPLSRYKNADVLAYIERHGLIRPECYGKGQSSGTSIEEINYLLWLRKNFPDDLKKVFKEFPMSERILFEHDYETVKGKQDGND